MTVIVDAIVRKIQQLYRPHMKQAFLFNAIKGNVYITFIYVAQHRLVNVRNIMRG